MFLTVTGQFLVTEFDVELPPGSLMGELGFLSPDNRRTATIECTEDGQVLTITYEKLLEIYFQNPQFGYYFLVLTSHRLLENIAGSRPSSRNTRPRSRLQRDGNRGSSRGMTPDTTKSSSRCSCFCWHSPCCCSCRRERWITGRRGPSSRCISQHRSRSRSTF